MRTNAVKGRWKGSIYVRGVCVCVCVCVCVREVCVCVCVCEVCVCVCVNKYI